MERTAAMVLVLARLDSTCARVEIVIRGYPVILSRKNSNGMEAPYVRAIESRPAPAPARAWATLSLCWDTAVVAIVGVSVASTLIEVAILERGLFVSWGPRIRLL